MGLAEAMSKLSIIIVNYNTCRVLLDCLRSIRQYAPVIPHEVIVVDNASKDDSVAQVQAQFPEVISIANSTNQGFSAANNQGLKTASGDCLLLLNSDTQVQEGALQDLVNCLNECPDTGLAGCQLLNADGSLQMSYNLVWNLLMLATQASGIRQLFTPRALGKLAHLLSGPLVPKTFRLYLQPHREPDKSKRGSYELDGETYLTGACLMIRRLCLEEIGLMDENFFMYSEDADLCLRACQAGWKLRFLPSSRIVHLVGASAGPSYRETSLEAYRSTLYYFRKHRGRLAFLTAKFLVSLMVVRVILAGLLRRNPPLTFGRGMKLLKSVFGIWSFPAPREPRLEVRKPAGPSSGEGLLGVRQGENHLNGENSMRWGRTPR